jgi:prepilin signal peptidase PulO-like enzyme (type II secretory pathway)
MIYLWFFVIGLVFGSFVNVLIYRLATSKNFWQVRSYCPRCKHILSAKELIPLFSFICQRGRCRYCQQKISLRYFFVEFFCACLFVIGYFYFGWQLALFKYLIFCVFALALAFIDGWKKIVPDELSLPLFFVITIISFFEQPGQWLMLLLNILIAGGFFAILHYCSRGKWMGSGDIRLGLIMGAMTINFSSLYIAIAVATISAALFGISRNAYIGRWLQTIAFGPFLLFGTWLAQFLSLEMLIKFVALL